jgi:uncharacterized protein YjbJ (UPF0337 family)
VILWGWIYVMADPGCACNELSARRGVILELSPKGKKMDRDRIKRSAQQAKGAVKEVAGKVTGEAKLKADKAAGRVQNEVGGVKDALRGK